MRHLPVRCLLVLIIASSAASAAAQSTFFIVRHAERADAGAPAASMMGADPDLSATGRARAESLAAMLKDAQITAIYVTEYKRTQQTAAPLARALGIEPVSIASKDTAALVRKLKADTGNVLVVGHSSSVPAVIKGLGVNEAVAVGEAEFDNLFIVTGTTPPALLRLRYR